MKKFNIFQVAGIWKSEEIHTRVIAELLNPQSQFHDKGHIFLEKFLEKLDPQNDHNLSAEDIKNISVETEVFIDNGRRIDMVISTPNYYLPFEVKIWAKDQENQLRDYYHYAKKQEKTVPCIYYLTPDGHEPSDWSLGSADDKPPVCTLSFQEDILPWLADCIQNTDAQSYTDLAEIMQQLHDNIKTNFLLNGDILEGIEKKLSKYHIEWTECTANYRTFPLYRKDNWEVALRIHRYRGGNKKVTLSVICGHVEYFDGEPTTNYAGNRKRTDVQPWLNATFRSEQYLDLKSSAWNWLKPEDPILKKDFDAKFEEMIFNQLTPEAQAWLLGKGADT